MNNHEHEAGGAPPGPAHGPPDWPPFAPPVRSRPEPVEASDERRRKDGGKKKKKKDRLGSDRGIETIFRNSYRTHIDMSALADNKANIMISINGLILSIMIASISSKIDTNPWLLLPTSVLLVTCLVSMVFAVLAARPRVTENRVTLDDVRQHRANILFFGSFVNLREDEYIQGMTELVQSPDRLYPQMMRDIYSLGGVLQRKFRLLRLSYNTFMAGLIVGVIAFIVVLISVAATSTAAIA